MAGGRGERMNSESPKPFIDFMGKPMIKWVIDAASSCRSVNRVFISYTEDLKFKGEIYDLPSVVTRGRGYVEDLVEALEKLDLQKTLILSADLPIITSQELEWVVSEYQKFGLPALSVFVTEELCRELGLRPGLTVDGLVPSGVNIVDGKNLEGEEYQLICDKPSFAFNINTQEDLRKGEIYLDKLSHPSNKFG